MKFSSLIRLEMLELLRPQELVYLLPGTTCDTQWWMLSKHREFRIRGRYVEYRIAPWVQAFHFSGTYPVALGTCGEGLVVLCADRTMKCIDWNGEAVFTSNKPVLQYQFPS